MRVLLSGQQMQAADLYTQETIGIPSLVLMERAALAVADRACACVASPANGRPLRVSVIAGKGNNGADALAVGRILTDRGMDVTYYVMDTAPAPETNSAIQLHILASYQANIIDIGANSNAALIALQSTYADIYIDGLFGIGLSREVAGVYRDTIDAINVAAERDHALVLAVDIPSGIDATTGAVLGTAVQAAETVTFGFAKRGQYLYPGCTYCGNLTIADIGIPAWSHNDPAWYTYDTESADDLLPERRADGNKGTYGKGLMIAGGYSMSGAATMAASAAGRMGCGMVKVYTRAENRVIMQETLPECLLSVWTPDHMDVAIDRLQQDLRWADTVAIGPALGKNVEEERLLRTVLEHAGDVRHIILDADAIRIIAEQHLYALLAAAGEQTDIILTPHLAECAALLGTTVSGLMTGREEQLRTFANAHHVTLLCKDARSMVVSAEDARTYLNTSGNDGLATAGSGDVLTGILTACTAQGMAGQAAAAAAAYLHGRLAEQAEGETGRRGLVAPDLYRRLSNETAIVWAESFDTEL